MSQSPSPKTKANMLAEAAQGVVAKKAPSASFKRGTPRRTPMRKKASKADIILVLGGDGTMIGSIRYLHSLNVPFLGINSGTVGFLTDLSLSKIDKLNITSLTPTYYKNIKVESIYGY